MAAALEKYEPELENDCKEAGHVMLICFTSLIEESTSGPLVRNLKANKTHKEQKELHRPTRMFKKT